MGSGMPLKTSTAAAIAAAASLIAASGASASKLGNDCQHPYTKTLIVRPGGSLRPAGDKTHIKVNLLAQGVIPAGIVYDVLWAPNKPGLVMCSAEFYFSNGTLSFSTARRGGSRRLIYKWSLPTGGLKKFIFKAARHRSLSQSVWVGPNIRPTPSTRSVGRSCSHPYRLTLTPINPAQNNYRAIGDGNHIFVRTAVQRRGVRLYWNSYNAVICKARYYAAYPNRGGWFSLRPHGGQRTVALNGPPPNYGFGRFVVTARRK
jgi:hypothetical protein